MKSSKPNYKKKKKREADNTKQNKTEPLMLKKARIHAQKKKKRQRNENGTKKTQEDQKRKLCPVEEWSVAPKTEKTLKHTRRCAYVCTPGSIEVPRQEGKPPFLPSRLLDHTQIHNRKKRKNMR